MNEPENVIAAQPLFSVLDWVVVVLYFTLMIGIGWWTARGQAGKRDYFLGGRNLPWWAVGFSIIATETSALTFIGIPAAAIGGIAVSKLEGTAPGVYQFILQGGNMFFMMLVVGYITGRLVVIKWIIPKYFTGEIYTTYELINQAFGERSRFAVAGLSVVQILLSAGVRVFVTAIPITLLLSTMGLKSGGILLSIIVIMVAALLYTSFGGLKAVVYTDMAQFIIFIVAGLATVLTIPFLIGQTEGGFLNGVKIIHDHARNGGPWQIWNIGLSSVEGAGILDHLKSILTAPENLITGLIAAPFGIILAFGFDQMNVQRILGCANAREGQKAMLLSAVLIGPQFFLFLYIGMQLFGFYAWNGFDFKGLVPVDPAYFAGEMHEPPAANNSYIYPIFIFTEMPHILKGLLLAAIFSAAMSSVSSALSALGSMALTDFYQPLVKDKNTSPKHELLISRISVLLAGIILTLVAFLCSAANKDLISLAFTLGSIPGGPMLGAFIFAFYKRKGHFAPVIIGITVSFLFMIQMNLDLIPNETIWPIFWPWHAMIGAVVCFAVSYSADVIIRAYFHKNGSN
ncbi:MAG: hypothetical protein ACFCU1_09780 [Sumerlaeia bacterium]